MRLGVLGLALILLAGACGGGGGTAAPTTTTLSVQRVATAVARWKSEIDGAIAFEDKCEALECMVGVNIRARWNHIADLIDQLDTDLSALPTAINHEVVPLVESTKALSRQVEATRREWEVCLDRTGLLPPCGTERTALEKAFRAVKSQLAAWQPYLGYSGYSG